MELIVENGKTYLSGIITEASTVKGKEIRPRNRNGRHYSTEILKPAFMKLVEKQKKDGFILSYRNHPSHAELIYEDSCAKMTDLRWDNKEHRGYGKFEILQDTEGGKQVLKDISNGIDQGNSTRSKGKLDENKNVTSLEIISSDIIPIVKNSNGYSSIQSCNSCTLQLTESIQEFESYYFDDFLIESTDDCDCYLNLDETEQQVVKTNLKNKIFELIDNI